MPDFAGFATTASSRPPRPLSIRVGKRMRRAVDRMIVRSSLVPNTPVLDPAPFAWTARLRADWRAIRDEALAVTARPEAVPPLAAISPDHARIAEQSPAGGQWRSFFLKGYGVDIADNIARCPATWAAVREVPGLNSAFFSILTPGMHIPSHRGVTKGLLTCHLGLVVPPGPIRMQVGDREVGWMEGATLVFDDTWRHEVWNDTAATRIVLLVQFARPLRQPGRAVAAAFLGAIRRSPFVRDARRNLASWDAALRGVEAAGGDR